MFLVKCIVLMAYLYFSPILINFLSKACAGTINGSCLSLGYANSDHAADVYCNWHSLFPHSTSPTPVPNSLY